MDYLEGSVSPWQSSGTGQLCIVEKWGTSGPWINWMDPIELLGSFRLSIYCWEKDCGNILMDLLR